MAAVAGGNSSLATQCLDLCQTLASQGMEFTFSVNIGPSFIFALDTRKKTSEVKPLGKRPSPSTLRRNASRREAFLKKKAQPPASSLVTPKMTEDSIIISEDFKCTQCDSPIKSKEELRTHIDDKHTVPVLKTPEKERSLPPISDLTLTPVIGERREEPPSSPSPTEEFNCDYYGHSGLCGKTFICKRDWRYHIHEVHGQCLDFFQRNPAVPCPWPGCMQRNTNRIIIS